MVGLEVRRAIVAGSVIAGVGLLGAGCGVVGKASEASSDTTSAHVTTVAPAGAAPAPTTTATGGGSTGKACDLVPPSEIEKVIGGPLRSPPKDDVDAQGTRCTYNSPGAIFEVTANLPAQYDAVKRRHQTTELSGLGDRAVEATDDPDDYIIGAVSGPHYVQFNIFHVKPDRAVVRTIMAGALAKSG